MLSLLGLELVAALVALILGGVAGWLQAFTFLQVPFALWLLGAAFNAGVRLVARAVKG